jgi:hypothetical protein
MVKEHRELYWKSYAANDISMGVISKKLLTKMESKCYLNRR